jgi:large subunit ribosomal protein L23
MNSTLKAPLISEKSMKDVSLSKFTFRVDKNATKQSIKKIIEEKFKVNVLKVSTVNVKGRKKRVGAKRTEVLEPSWKKAIVKLKSGQKIDLFDVGGAK